MARFLGVLVALVALVGCGGNVAINQAHIRFAHLVPDGGRLAYYFGDSLKFVNVEYPTITPYRAADSGAITLNVGPFPGNTYLAQAFGNVTDAGRYTAVTIGYRSPQSGEPSLSMFVLQDESIPPPTGESRLRVVQAAPNTNALDWYVTLTNVNLNDVEPDFTNIGLGEASAYANFGVGTRRLRATLPGTKTVVYDTSIGLSGRQIYTLYLRLTTSGPVAITHSMVKDGG
ncbi:MAG: hypothetical protein BGO01_11465 [Armatimonadetes bacterium 55-13]|nr:DUF4397 domain-containing protein [Armatimonadota bacterium]OJU63232.1 MAG: hypothetical protein BGO01_11465 [Armatimonadetes bacterium 55-13]